MEYLSKYECQANVALQEWRGYKDQDGVWSIVSQLKQLPPGSSGDLVIGSHARNMCAWRLGYLISSFADTAGCEGSPLHPIVHLVDEFFNILYATNSYITGPIIHGLEGGTAPIRLYYPSFKDPTRLLRYVSAYITPHLEVDLLPYNNSVDSIMYSQALTCEMAAFGGRSFTITKEYVEAMLSGHARYNPVFRDNPETSVRMALESGFMITLPPAWTLELPTCWSMDLRKIINALDVPGSRDFAVSSYNPVAKPMLTSLQHDPPHTELSYIYNRLQGLHIDYRGVAMVCDNPEFGETVIVIHAPFEDVERERSTSRGRSVDSRSTRGRSGSTTRSRCGSVYSDRSMSRGRSARRGRKPHIGIFLASYSALQRVLTGIIAGRVSTPSTVNIYENDATKFIEVPAGLSCADVVLYAELHKGNKMTREEVSSIWTPRSFVTHIRSEDNHHPFAHCLHTFCERIGTTPVEYYFTHSRSVMHLCI